MTHTAHPSDPITAWAVRLPSGAISLFLDAGRARLYAADHHATLHRLVEWIDPTPAYETDPEPPAHRMPQGHTTPGGLVRI